MPVLVHAVGDDDRSRVGNHKGISIGCSSQCGGFSNCYLEQSNCTGGLSDK